MGSIHQEIEKEIARCMNNLVEEYSKWSFEFDLGGNRQNINIYVVEAYGKYKWSLESKDLTDCILLRLEINDYYRQVQLTNIYLPKVMRGKRSGKKLIHSIFMIAEEKGYELYLVDMINSFYDRMIRRGALPCDDCHDAVQIVQTTNLLNDNDNRMEKNNITVNNASLAFLNDYKQKYVSWRTVEKFNFIDFLAIPVMYGENEYSFVEETVAFINFCRDRTDKYSFDILADEHTVASLLQTENIWVPIIWVASSRLLPALVNIVDMYIYDRMKGRENKAANVQATFFVQCGDEVVCINYSGGSETFKENFQNSFFNKM